MLQKLLSLIVVAWAALPPAALLSDTLAIAPKPGVLLLNNGELIEGTIIAAGDRFDVEIKDGSLSVKRSDVAAVCASAEECYLRKRGGIDSLRPGDHLELAEWCLRQRLLNHAEEELAAARALDPAHPKLRLLQPRLELARQAPPDAAPMDPADKLAPPEQLDSLARNLPAGSMESFTNAVQPLLLNYCSKAGCHGPRSTNLLRLERISRAGLVGRHPTQRNMQAAMALVNRESPSESPLLQIPIRPHAAMKAPVFTEREQAQYKQLVQWVYLISANHQASPRPTLDERGAPLLQTLSTQAPSNTPPTSATPALVEPQEAPAAPSPDEHPIEAKAPESDALRVTQSRGQLVLRPVPRRGESAEYIPRDPFDPEIFNRRFFGPAK
jgi:hypothetical protein